MRLKPRDGRACIYLMAGSNFVAMESFHAAHKCPEDNLGAGK